MMSTLPDNWEEMGARARHEWHVAHCKAVKATPAATPTVRIIAPLNPANAIQEQYFYYSKMIKSDEQSLKSIPDHAERDKRKPSLLNKYREYLTEYMAAKETHDNNVLFFCIVWACDCEQWDWAIELCDYATLTKQSNDIFRRGHEDICADSVFVFAEKQIKAGALLPDCFTYVFERITGNAWTVDKITQSRYYKLMGDLITESQPTDALAYFKKANDLNENIGVKGRIKTLEATL